jgi:hypothetical protein
VVEISNANDCFKSIYVVLKAAFYKERLLMYFDLLLASPYPAVHM